VKVLFLFTEDWYFWSHALQLARKLRDSGVEVVVMTRLGDFQQAIEQEGFRLIPWCVVRRNMNPFREVTPLFEVCRAYRRERPDLVHHVALKPIIHGGIAAQVSGVIRSVNGVVGLGHVFVNNTLKMKVVRRMVVVLLRFALMPSLALAVFQNEDNRRVLLRLGVMPAEQTSLIRGAGVDDGAFLPTPEPQGPPVIMMVSRMLREKGVEDFVRAAHKLRGEAVSARFVLVGKPDPGNPGSIHESQLNTWCTSGVVEWWGNRDDMPNVIGQSNIVCFPSFYSEGVPRVLLEAASCGRAIVTTDTPGCRDVVRHGENGILVPPHDPMALAKALKELIQDPQRRAKMAWTGRQIVVNEFSQGIVIEQMMEVYRSLLGSRWIPVSSKPAAADETRTAETSSSRN
jgi:glycosyltransferase involved in cell wall biosynthesis